MRNSQYVRNSGNGPAVPRTVVEEEITDGAAADVMKIGRKGQWSDEMADTAGFDFQSFLQDQLTRLEADRQAEAQAAQESDAKAFQMYATWHAESERRAEEAKVISAENTAKTHALLERQIELLEQIAIALGGLA
jgi:hypothetical protein